MHNFRELKVWHKAKKLVKEVYITTKPFPKEELYGLTNNQMRRCAVSIPSNIAEGCGRGSDPQLIYFLDVAHGSSCELETQVLLANDLEFILDVASNDLIIKIHEVQKMIIGFKNSLNS
jgi:four helix bundle protein